ncbi:MAG TPA: response regulator transcription factor [Pseudogracilibacillus sp.]|nr:response regulator transcription factor [Pseudogracilibacillus sp.]
MTKILIVEDEENIRSFIRINLKREGYEVFEVDNGEDGIQFLKDTPDCSLVLLDIMLPGISGFDVCQQLRTWNQTIGVIMLTAKTLEEDKVNGLLTGADDYIAKPFSPNELIARIQTLLRRVPSYKPMATMELDHRQRCIKKDGMKIELSPTEYEILHLLDQAKTQALHRNEILDSVWGLNYVGDPKIVDVNIRRIRRKIELDPSNPRFLQTVWGYGYRWVTRCQND